MKERPSVKEEANFALRFTAIAFLAIVSAVAVAEILARLAK